MFPGYTGKIKNRKNKNKKSKRNFGGILVLYKYALVNYITVTGKKDQNILWLKINESVVGETIILGTVYISPEHSTTYDNKTMTEHTFTTLSKHIASFDKDSLIIIGCH